MTKKKGENRGIVTNIRKQIAENIIFTLKTTFCFNRVAWGG